MDLLELVDRIGGSVYPPSKESINNIQISGVGSIVSAQKGQVSFITSGEFIPMIPDSEASALIVGEVIPDCDLPQIVHENPYYAFAKASQIFLQRRSISLRDS